ncbi:MAG: hypothetical protein EOP36_18085 [Rubrivivax sp.]|nr:MAG: hypothetical protein EOP36_18085 [Rubrivivax sp.]
MHYHCNYPACGSPTSGRSRYCNAHRLTLRRHGHPGQVGIKVTEYGGHRAAIRKLWDTNEGNPLWNVIDARWQRCKATAEATLASATTGAAYNRHEQRAAEELLKLARNVPFQVIACTALAIYVFQADRPHRFRDDQAFAFQLVRKVRALDDLAVYRVWNPKRKRVHRAYRDLPPGAVRILAGFLSASFGEAGLLLRDHEKSRPRLQATESKLMADALRSLR